MVTVTETAWSKGGRKCTIQLRGFTPNEIPQLDVLWTGKRTALHLREFVKKSNTLKQIKGLITKQE